MNTKIHSKIEWLKLSPSDGHYFFGYYDRDPWNGDMTMHLALKAPQCERLPEQGESAEIGFIERSTGKFIKCADTRAWCHQQGAMQQWLKHIPNTFIFNDYDLGQKKLITRIYQVGKGIIGQYDLPIYIISPNGCWGISLNFSRIPRRGYSYADAPRQGCSCPDLDNDGLFLIDMHSGKSKLLISYRSILERYPLDFELKDRYWWINHPGFSCDSAKLLFLFRHCNRENIDDNRWKTYMFTTDLDDNDLSCILPDFYWDGKISHQLWGRTSDEILVDANWRNRKNEYVVLNNKPDFKAQLISPGMGSMGHLIFSPDGKYMLADTYPLDGVQRLALVDCKDGTWRIIGKFKHNQPKTYCIDVRCDLHPRWSLDGSLVSVDSIHDGRRQIYMTTNLIQKLGSKPPEKIKD